MTIFDSSLFYHFQMFIIKGIGHISRPKIKKYTCIFSNAQFTLVIIIRDIVLHFYGKQDMPHHIDLSKNVLLLVPVC